MALKEILIYPDVHLKTICTPVEAVDADVEKLACDMLETMYGAPGIGLAAPQVGALRRLLVMDCSGKEESAEPMVLINPSVVWSSDETNVYNEGCLSLPEMYEDVERPATVRVRFLGLDSVWQEREFDEIWATCVQHEIDHLNGKLFIDHLSGLKRSMITKKMRKFKKERMRE